MRLIDADELINFLRTENQRCITSTGHELSLSIIATLIECQPTAYDVDTVVAELDKNAKRHGGEDYFVEFGDAIEIVKHGGVSDDACEWYADNKGNYKCKAHAETYDSRVLDWNLCPYCSKKIKVVE